MATCFSKQNFLFRICFILAVVVTPTIGEGKFLQSQLIIICIVIARDASCVNRPREKLI